VVLLARGRGPQRDDQPLGQRLAAEEERGVLDVEDLQPAIGAHALEGRAVGVGARQRGLRGRAAGAGARLFASDAADQQAERLLVIVRAAELDPGRRGQERRQLPPLGTIRPRQENGDDTELPLALADPPLDGRAHLLVLPGTQPLGADEHGAGRAFVQRLLDGWLPAFSRDQVPYIEPRPDLFTPQPDGQLLDRRLVGAVVREEHMVFEASRRHRVGLDRIVVKRPSPGHSGRHARVARAPIGVTPLYGRDSRSATPHLSGTACLVPAPPGTPRSPPTGRSGTTLAHGASPVPQGPSGKTQQREALAKL